MLIHPMCVVWHWQCCGNMWLWPWPGVCGFSLGLGFGDRGGLGLNLCLGSFGLVNVTAVKVYFSLVCAANKPLGFLPTVFAGNVAYCNRPCLSINLFSLDILNKLTF